MTERVCVKLSQTGVLFFVGIGVTRGTWCEWYEFHDGFCLERYTLVFFRVLFLVLFSVFSWYFFLETLFSQGVLVFFSRVKSGLLFFAECG